MCAAPIVQQLATCVSCHAWNADRSKLAFCPDNNEVHIYKKGAQGWEKEVVLAEHDSLVTGIDWAPKTNRIVTCSQDRNAYVWTPNNNAWKPTLVILRINRAATSVKWSPNEQKFAVASGAKCVSICYFEEDNDWWVSKHVKKHKSTVTCVSWHPNNVLIATGSSDFKARIFAAFIKGVDQPAAETAFGPSSKLVFGNVLAEYNSSGWVHDVAFSPSGNTLAFVSHDSRVNFVRVGSDQVDRVAQDGLPYRSCIFVSEEAAVCGGYDCCPHLFTFAAGSWKFNRNLDQTAKAATANKQSGTGAARAMFQAKVDYGTTENETTLNSQHQNAINSVQPFQAAGGKVAKVSTTSVDGKLIIWTL